MLVADFCLFRDDCCKLVVPLKQSRSCCAAFGLAQKLNRGIIPNGDAMVFIDCRRKIITNQAWQMRHSMARSYSQHRARSH
jgi:hypothetical protein